MAGQSVEITLTVDEMQALAAYTRQQQALDKLQKKAGEIKSSDDPMASLKAGMASVGASFKDAAVQIIGIGSAVGGLMALAERFKSEIANMRSRQANAAGGVLEYAVELPKAVRAAGGMIDASRMDQLILQGSKATGKSQSDIAANFTSAFAAVGPKTEAQVLDTIEVSNAVAKAFPDEDRETSGKLVSAIAHNKRAFKMSTPEAIGYMQMVANKTFPDSATALASNVAPRLPGIALSGDFSDAEAASLYGTVSQFGGDTEGSKSGSASQLLGGELKERLPKLKDGMERIRYMREHPELLPAFFNGGMFDGKKFGAANLGMGEYKPIISQVLTAGTQEAKDLDENVKTVGSRKKWVEDQQKIQADIDAHPVMQAFQVKRQFDTSEKQIQIDDVQGAMAGISREGLQSVLKAAGVSDTEQQWAAGSFEYNTSIGSKNPLREVRRQLSDQIDTLEHPNSYSDTRAFFSGLTAGLVPYSLQKTPEEHASDKLKAKRLREARGQLEEIDTAFEQSTKRRNEAMAEPPMATPAPSGNESVTSPANSPQASLMLNEFRTLNSTIAKLTAKLELNTQVTAVNNQATAMNTQSLPRTGTQPTVRPIPVTSLQNARRLS